MPYVLTDFYGKQWEVNGVVHRDDLLFATMKTNGDVPIYSIKYNNEFARYYRDCIKDNDNIRHGGQGDTEGPSR